MLPQKLKAGTYYLKEVKAPKGYLLREEPVEFKVTGSGDWENPIIVQCEDTPVMGRIVIRKSDEITGETLGGAVFEISAAADIVTGDGTVRAEKDEVVDRITTGRSGKAVSGKLYPGKYSVREIKAAPGYVLSDKAYKADFFDTAVVPGTAHFLLKITDFQVISLLNRAGKRGN